MAEAASRRLSGSLSREGRVPKQRQFSRRSGREPDGAGFHARGREAAGFPDRGRSGADGTHSVSSSGIPPVGFRPCRGAGERRCSEAGIRASRASRRCPLPSASDPARRSWQAGASPIGCAWMVRREAGILLGGPIDWGPDGAARLQGALYPAWGGFASATASRRRNPRWRRQARVNREVKSRVLARLFRKNFQVSSQPSVPVVRAWIHPAGLLG